jgi:hypothetical protein
VQCNTLGKNDDDAVLLQYRLTIRYSGKIIPHPALFFRYPVYWNPVQAFQQKIEQLIVEHIAPDRKMDGLPARAADCNGIHHGVGMIGCYDGRPAQRTKRTATYHFFPEKKQHAAPGKKFYTVIKQK